MKFIYTNEKKEEVEATLEKWAWGVVYKPTEEQITEAKRLSIQRRDELTIERNQKLKEARERGDSKEDIEMITKLYEHTIEQNCIPKQDELKQFEVLGEEGKFHRFAEIDQDRVEVFTMFRTDDEDLTKRIDIAVTPGMKLFHFYRQIGLDYQNKENFRKIKIYVFGWKDENRGATYNYILPDDRIIISNKDVENLLAFNI